MIPIGPVELVLIVAVIAAVVFIVKRSRRVTLFEEIPSTSERINNADVMAELRRIAGPDPREIARRCVEWTAPLPTKADVLTWLGGIPTGATPEEFDAAGKQLFRSRGLPLPRNGS